MNEIERQLFLASITFGSLLCSYSVFAFSKKQMPEQSLFFHLSMAYCGIFYGAVFAAGTFMVIAALTVWRL